MFGKKAQISTIECMEMVLTPRETDIQREVLN